MTTGRINQVDIALRLAVSYQGLADSQGGQLMQTSTSDVAMGLAERGALLRS